MNLKLYQGMLVIGILFCMNARAAQYILPKQGQSAEQQQQDEYYCHKWATQQTGFDPSAAVQSHTASAPTASTPAQAVPGSGARGVLRGAGRDWIIGKVADGDSGDAAAAGATMGGIRGRTQGRHEQQLRWRQAQQQRFPSQSLAQQDYLHARAACLDAKGYTVK